MFRSLLRDQQHRSTMLPIFAPKAQALLPFELYPENSVEIYNRWGIKVYDVTGYGQNGRYFVGESDGRATIQRSKLLPTGAYFYILKYKTTSGVWKDRKGYLYLTR